MEDSISHTDAPNAFRSNQLNELGQKIFLDRYALKDVSKRTLSVGDMVIVCVDDKTGQREIAIVRSMEGNRVTVELQDSTTLDRLIEHVSKPIETAPEQMMERVARGIAAVEGEQAEDWYHKFRWLLDGWKFVPAGRILTAAGTDQQLTFYNCMPPDQEVLTADGYKPIAEVSIGEMVVTHRNRLRRVLHKFERETEEPIYTIKAKKLGYDDLRVTGEHKILAIRSEWVNAHKSRDGLKLQQEPQWIPARELKPGDYLAMPYDGKERPSSSVCIAGYAECDELWWVGIESIETVDYSGRVLDMEVEEDHSFVSAGLVLSNCYVVPSPKDSRRGIVETLSQMMEIMSRGGGVGINVSSLRPRHSYVKGVNGRSSGSVSWGALYSFVTGLIEQGGCLTPDTMVFTEEGLLRLDEIVRHEEKGWRDQNLVVMTDEGQRASRQVFNNGIADVLTVSTDMGIELTGTPNHKVKVMTDRGPQWKQLSELQRGDAIMIKLDQHAGKQQELKKPDIKHHNQDAVELPDVLDEDLAFFLGYMAGDGFMTAREGDWRLGVAVSHDSYLIEEMPALIERLFRGTHVRVQQKENDASLNYIISNRAVKEFLIINGLAKTRSAEASIPRLIRQSPPEVVAAFLRGLLEADGSVSHGYPMLVSVSKQLIDETATLLIGLGCPVKVEAQPSGKDHYGDKQIWRLRVHSFKGLENWKAKIGCDPRSRFAVCSNFEPDLTREVSYRLPHPQHWIEPVLSAMALPQIDHRATGQHIKAIDPALRRKLLRYLRGDRNLTLSAYAALARSHASFSEHARPIDDTWFVYVKSVRKAGQSLTLDLEVDDNHTYIANGMVTHNSRRGALMLILNCWHPDVLEFINSKRDMGKITNANISVGITDKFMEAVHQDADWELVFPDTSDPDYETSWDGNLEKWIAAGKKINVYNTVKARAVWNSIIESAWASAEPGVFFIERANKMSNSWYYDAGYLGCTNPCVTGDTLVSTPDGWKRADSIKEGDYIATVLGSGVVETVEAHESVPVFKVTLSDGAVLRVTAAHRFHAIKRGDRVKGNRKFAQIRLDRLEVGDYVRIAPALIPENSVPDKPMGWLDREYGFILGILLGDGCYTPKMLSQNRVEIACDAREAEWIEMVEGIMHRAGAITVTQKQGRDLQGDLTNSLSLKSNSRKGLASLVKNSLLSPAFSHEKDIPIEYINTNSDFLAGLLDGLWSTDGNVNLSGDHPLLRFKTSSEKLAQSVRRILLMFGIHGRIAHSQRAPHSIDGREIRNDRPVFEVIVSGSGIKTFAERVGITHPQKADKLKQAQIEFALTGNTWAAQIKSIDPVGSEAVYDLYEPQSDTWITDGVVNQGCGEQPLPGFGVCNLGAINLSKFVRDGDVAWDDLGEAVRCSVRFLDNVIDATPYFFDENFAQQKSERRVGLNTMGLAEMLIRLGIRYGSDESVAFIERLYLFIATESYRASSEIAAEKGSFSAFDADKFLQSGYMQTMPEEIRQMVREKGMRNVTLLTQAPNGCVTPDTLVFANGALRPIATLGDADGEQWQSISITTHSDTGSKSADKFYVNGLREVAEITTARGFRLAATLHHRVRVIDCDGSYEWRQMGELQPGDTVVMARGGLSHAASPRLLPVPTENQRVSLRLPDAMTTDLAELLGFYTGDGYLKDRRGLGIAVDARDEDVVGKLQELIGRVFDLDARIDDTGRNCLMVWAGSYFIPRWMRANGLAKSNAFDARIPEAVLAGGAQTVAAFLRGLFESDGSISNGVVTFVTASERLAGEVQIALLGLGIVSTRRSLEPGEGRYGESLRHEVRLLNSAEVLRFREQVGFASKRKQALLDQCVDRGSRADSIPSALLRKIYVESEGLPTGIRQEIASAIRCGMTQQRWRDLASENPALGRLPSAHLLDGRLFFDSVASIDLNHSLTFDLSVPDTNTYVANGIVAHNTIGTMVGTSTGIEPFYFWSYYRKSRLGQHEERVGVMEEWQQSHPKEELPQFFVTAMDLAPEEHVKVQAAIQRWVDSSISKCVTGDTLVLTANGLMPIEEISDMRQPDEFQSLEIEVITPSGIEKTDAFYYGGMRETRRVSLSFGYEIEGTLNHRVHVLNPDGSIGFARFDDLAIGDTVVLYSGQKIFGPSGQTLPVYSGAWNTNAKSIRFPEKMSPELAYVLGCITSEGCIAQNFVSISNSDRSLLEKLSVLFEELFDLESSIYEDKRRERLFSLQVNSRPLKNWLLNDLGLEAGAENKIIPSCILRASREEIEAFLRGLMLDAYMTLDGRMFGIGLATRKLIRQLQTLLLNFGVLSRMHRSAERAWALTVAGDSLDILATFIEFDDAWKAERLARRNEGRTIKRLNYSELMPSHLTAELRISQLSSSKSLRSLYRGDTPEYQRARISLNRGSRLSRETASLLHEHFDDVGSDYADRFFEKDQSGCVYIQVEAVERRVAEVFDLSVPGSHTFIANGLGNHNTCNLPSSYTVDQTREVYELLYRLGCKGGTIYRDGSRDVQVLNLKEEDKRVSEKAREETEAKIATDDSSEMVKSNGGLQPKVRPRPYKRRGYTVSKATPSGTAHITMNEDEEGQPFEVFLEIGKAGSDIKAMAEAMGRLMSLILRMASPVSPIERVSEIVKQITGIGGARSYGFGKRRVLSLPDAVGQALAENYMGVTSGSEEAGQGAEMGVENAGAATKQKEIAMHSASADLCPHCGDSAFVRIEGCQTCYACGYSEC